MLGVSVSILVLCMVFVPFAQSGKMDIDKFYKEYGTCNGETPSLPVEWMPAALAAAGQCVDYQDEYCQKVCFAFAYPDLMKNGKLDNAFVKKEARKVKLNEKNEKARDELVAGVEKCSKILPKLSTPGSSDTCPEAKKFQKCMEDEFQYACKGKKRPADQSAFLDM